MVIVDLSEDEEALILATLDPLAALAEADQVRCVSASYSDRLTVRDNLKCRRLIQPPWHQQRWGHRFRPTEDRNAKVKFENNRTGFKLATSVNGLGTGDGFMIDDPHNVKQAESAAVREVTLMWFTGTVQPASTTRSCPPSSSSCSGSMRRMPAA